MICPYCKNPASYGANENFYGKRWGRSYMCYYCKPCGAYVGCHNNTTQPLGTMANQELRDWRKKVHVLLDPIWKSGRMKRQDVYAWLSKELGIKTYHTGETDIDMCKKVIKILELCT